MKRVAIGTLVLLSLCTSLAAAQDGGGALVRPALLWTNDWGAECFDGETIVQGVHKRLHRSAFVATEQADVVVRGAVSRVGSDGWEVALELLEPGGLRLGTRRIRSTSADCHSLIEPTSLVIAVMVDMPREELARRILVAASKSSARYALRFGAGGTVTVGLLPAASLSPQIWASVASNLGWRATLGASLSPGQSKRIAGGTAEFQSTLLQVNFCPEHTAGRTRLAACAGIGGGRIRAETSGFDVTSRETRWTALLAAELTGDIRMTGWLWATLRAGAALPIRRDRYFYEPPSGQLELVHRSWPVVPYALLGLEAQLNP